MSWINYTLKDLVSLKQGFALNKKSQHHLSGDNSGLPLLKISDLINGTETLFVKSTIPEQFLVTPSEIIYSRTGQVGIAFMGKTGVVYNNCFKVIPNEKLDSVFIFHWLNSKPIRDYIKSLATGAAQPDLNHDAFKSVKINLPPLETQKRIASILSTYDDLIENNLKRIKLLEETAQNIYKEWFVNFRFPNYEHTEFDKESGLPVGWEKKTIDAFAEVITGKTPSTANSNFYGGNIPFVKTPDMHDAPYVLSTNINLSNEGAESQNNKFLPKNSVMVSCIGTAGVVALASTNCQTNQQINSVRFDEEFKAFYFYGFARGLRTLLEGLGSNGATMVNVNKSKFEKIEIIVSDSETLKKHYGLVKVIFDQILILQEQNEKLKEARDILLPRLMNRTIEV
jgi:type I restriction enzyme S subunit